MKSEKVISRASKVWQRTGLLILIVSMMVTTSLPGMSHPPASTLVATEGIGIVITEDICRVGYYDVSGLPTDWIALAVYHTDAGTIFECGGNGNTITGIDLTGKPMGTYYVTITLPASTASFTIYKTK